MTEPISTSPASADARADIAFLKRMAMDGRGEPAPALVLMAVFGLVYGVVALGLYIQIATADGRPPFGQSGPWSWFNNFSMPVATLAFLAALGWTGWRSLAADRRPLNRGALAAWSGAFLALVITLVAIRVFTRNEPPTDAVYGVYLTAPVLLILWGVAWWTTAIVSRRPWLIIVALASWAMAILAAWVGNSLLMLAIAAASLLGLAFLPAVILMARKRRVSEPLLAAPVRAGILAFLSVQGEGDFASLARALNVANNTLSSHLQRLEAAGWIELRRGFLGRKPRTVITLTGVGRSAWTAHLAQL